MTYRMLKKENFQNSAALYNHSIDLHVRRHVLSHREIQTWRRMDRRSGASVNTFYLCLCYISIPWLDHSVLKYPKKYFRQPQTQLKLNEGNAFPITISLIIPCVCGLLCVKVKPSRYRRADAKGERAYNVYSFLTSAPHDI
jgi:hypothetical protein